MEKTLLYLPVEELHPHPDNPRKELGDLTELADSIKRCGIMQNLTVVPRAEGGYTVIIGHRRLAAAKEAGLWRVPCVVAEMSEREQLATMLLENMQRSDLTAYEQAQGFQLMINFGESVESISDKTGFSETTVRRRLKMAELDQETLKSVSSARQLNIGDFDRLAQLDDIEERNALLADIGTVNFNSSLASKLKKQNIDKKLPLVRQELKLHKAKKIEQSQAWYDYERLGEQIRFYEWDPQTSLLPPEAAQHTDKLYYVIDVTYGTLSFYKELPKKKPQKRPQAEIDREKLIDGVRTELTEKTADFCRLRHDFIQGLHATSKNIDQILAGAVTAAMLHVVTYVRSDSTRVNEILGVDENVPYDEKLNRRLQILGERGKAVYPQIIYTAFGDGKENGYVGGAVKDYPEHRENKILDALYDWLCSLGYQMSDEERALREGTHILFEDPDTVDNT